MCCFKFGEKEEEGLDRVERGSILGFVIVSVATHRILSKLEREWYLRLASDPGLIIPASM